MISAPLSVAPTSPDRSQLAVGALLVAGLLWGLTWMPFRYFGSHGLNGITFTMLSYGLVGLVVLPWLILRGRRWLPQRGLVALIALASGILYASQNIFTRAADRTPLHVKTLAVFVGCGFLSGAIAVLTGQSFPPVSDVLLAQLVAFAGIWMMAAMIFTVYGVTHLEAGRSAVLLVFELVAAMVSAMWIGGERLAGLEWAEAALITSAALLEARSYTKDQGKIA